MKDLSNLTKNQTLVFDALSKAKIPLSAYTILDLLRDDGFRAPPQVYRALDKLQALGLIHRLESLNAFVACSHAHCNGHGLIAFAICEDCNEVIELAEKDIEDEIISLAGKHNFTPKSTSIEISGTCEKCLANQSN